jgi:PKD repeat protein
MKNRYILPAIIFISGIFSGCSSDEDGLYTPYHEPAVLPVVSFIFSGNDTFAPAAVHFQNATTNAYSYKWNFGDGYTSGEGNPIHIYEEGGTYIVKLIATGQAGTDSATKAITVLNAPTKLRILSITLTDFPFTKPAGGYWDAGTGPDVLFKIMDNDTNVFYDGTALIDSNVAPADLPLVWDLASPFLITDFTKYKAVKIYDGDFPNPDEYIGKAGFTPQSYANAQEHYPASIDIFDGEVFITLKLKWE